MSVIGPLRRARYPQALALRPCLPDCFVTGPIVNDYWARSPGLYTTVCDLFDRSIDQNDVVLCLNDSRERMVNLDGVEEMVTITLQMRDGPKGLYTWEDWDPLRLHALECHCRPCVPLFASVITWEIFVVVYLPNRTFSCT